MGTSGRWLRDRRKGSKWDFALYIYIYSFGVARVIERNLVVVLYRKSFLLLFLYAVMGF